MGAALRRLSERRKGRSVKDKIYQTSFCNHGHRLHDGKPVGHECFILPTEMLEAERVGDMGKAHEVQMAWKNRRRHNGVRKT